MPWLPSGTGPSISSGVFPSYAAEVKEYQPVACDAWAGQPVGTVFTMISPPALAYLHRISKLCFAPRLDATQYAGRNFYTTFSIRSGGWRRSSRRPTPGIPPGRCRLVVSVIG